MELPSRYHIQSAQRCARLIGLDAATVDEIESAFRSAATQGMFRVQDLRSGRSLLEALQLLRRERETLYPDAALLEFGKCSEDEAMQISFTRLMETVHPIWLASAIEGSTIIDEYIPTKVAQYFDDVFLDLDRRESILLAVSQKFDSDRLSAIGLQGELAVLNACREYLEQAGRQDLRDGVVHVSKISDQLGYDIVSPTLDDRRVRMEVKSTRSLKDYAVYISRLEAAVGRADDDWRLVFCRIQSDNSEIVGHCSFSAIEDQMPIDQTPGEWSVTRLQLSMGSLQAGVPL